MNWELLFRDLVFTVLAVGGFTLAMAERRKASQLNWLVELRLIIMLAGASTLVSYLIGAGMAIERTIIIALVVSAGYRKPPERCAEVSHGVSQLGK